jgi:hypothetical protein
MRARNVLLAIVIIIGGMIITSWHKGSLAQLRSSHDWEGFLSELGSFASSRMYEGNWFKIDTVTKQIDPGNAATLVVDNPRGNITLTGGSGNEVIVKAIRFGLADSVDVARSKVNDLSFELTREGDTIRVVTTSRKHASNAVKYDLRISVPKHLALDVKTVYGDITINATTSNVNVESNAGSISINGAAGVTAKTNFGNVSVSNAKSIVSANSNAGEIVIDTAPEVKATAQCGNIELKNITGPLDCRGNFGNISLVNYTGQNATLRTATGEIRATQSVPLTGDIRATTSWGSIYVYLPTASNCSIDLHSTGGGVQSDLPLQHISRDPTHLSGILGDGKGYLNLRSTGGHVAVLAAHEKEASTESGNE